MPPAAARLGWLIGLSICALAAQVLAHGGQPRVRALTFPPQFPDRVFVVTDSQGLYIGAREGGDFRWLCEDGIAPYAGVRQAVPLGADQTRWVVGSDEAVFRTTDRGCSFGPIEDTPEMLAAGGLATQRAAALLPHPTDPARALLATDGFGRPNDVWRTTDAGRTWVPAGLNLPGGVNAMLRSEANPDFIYLAHSEGALASTDGGLTFGAIKLGPGDANVRPEELKLLSTHPTDPRIVFAAVERFPDTLLIRTADAGQSWRTVDAIPDFPLNLAIALNGQDALVVSPFEGLRRSTDGGLTWQAVDLPVARLGCLTRPPGEATLFACSDVFFGGPWVVGRSEDFGRTWRPVLGAYVQAASAWTCTREAPARACCQHLCPGLAAGQECPGRAPAPGPTCPFAEQLQPDGGVPDGGSPSDAGVPSDAAGGAGGGGGGAGNGGGGGTGGADDLDGGGAAGGSGGTGGSTPGADAHPPGADAGASGKGGGGGCGQAPSPRPTVPLAWALGIGYCVWRARRRPQQRSRRRA